MEWPLYFFEENWEGVYTQLFLDSLVLKGQSHEIKVFFWGEKPFLFSAFYIIFFLYLVLLLKFTAQRDTSFLLGL